jgi:hypothetical protein
MVAGFDVTRRIDLSIFNLSPTQLPRWCHVHHPPSRFHQSSDQTRNPNQTCFHVKQAARSRHVSHTDLPPSVLCRNRQTEVHLVLRHKPRNHRGDFEDQITKPKLSVLMPKPETLHHLGFDAQPRNSPPILRSNREKLSPPVLRSNWRKLSQQVLRSNC